MLLKVIFISVVCFKQLDLILTGMVCIIFMSPFKQDFTILNQSTLVPGPLSWENVDVYLLKLNPSSANMLLLKHQIHCKQPGVPEFQSRCDFLPLKLGKPGTC